MSSHQADETPKVDVPLSLFVKAKFAELLAELVGCAASTENALLGEGLPRGKPLVKPESRRDLFQSQQVSVQIRACCTRWSLLGSRHLQAGVGHHPNIMLQRLEQHTWLLTMIGSFLDCSGFSANSLLDDASKDFAVSKTMRQLVGACSDLEKSQGRAAGHVLSGAS